MKKVKSIGKKVMSVGLAASLLLAPVSANTCSATIADDCKKAAKISAGVAITATAVTIYLGLQDTEAAKALIESVGSAIGGAGNLVYYSLDSVCKIIVAVGVKNALVGAGLWQFGNWIYRFYNWLTEPKKEENSNKRFNKVINNNYYNCGPKEFDSNSKLNDDEDAE